MHLGHGVEQSLGAELERRRGSQLVREDIQQYLGIGIGVDMPTVILEQLAAQRVGIDQIAVVRKGNAVG